MKKIIVLALISGAFMSATVQAAGNAARGQQKAATCAACHGPDGNSPLPTFPRLAGQNEDYLVHALRSYKDGKRKNAIMQPLAAPLSLQDMEDLAAYFARQKGLVVKR